MRAVLSILIAVALVLAIADEGLARGRRGGGFVRAGLSEVNISSSLNIASAEGESYTVYQFAGAYGYFISPVVELGANLTLTKPEEVDAYGTFAGFVSIHFAGGRGVRTIPFVGGQVGHSFGYEDIFGEDYLSFGGAVGAKTFVGDGGGAITNQFFYIRDEFENLGLNNYGLQTGVSIFF